MQGIKRIGLKLSKGTLGQLASVTVICCAILGWRFFSQNPSLAWALFRDWGYWAMLGLVLLTALAWLRFWYPQRMAWSLWIRRHRLGLIFALGGALFFQLHEPRKFKVLYDEYGFSGIAYDMHYSREATCPSRAHYVEGRLYVLNHLVDKRPVLFSFLISILHDLTGYRPENVFYLNAFFGGFLLFAIYLLAAAWKCPEGGWIAQLLLIGLPLVAQNATGGGYDLVNLTFLCLFALAATAYLKTAGTRGLDVLVGAAVLLAQLRYESAFMSIACLVIVLYKWYRTRCVRLTWTSVALVAFMILPVMVNKISMSLPAYFENKPGQPMASLSYISGNFAHAVFYLYSFSLGDMNNPLLSYGGTVALFFVLVRFGKRLAGRQRPGDELLIVGVVSLICLSSTLLMMSWFWADWDDPAATRFSFILQFAFILSIIWCVKNFPSRKKISPVFITGLALFALGWSVPASASASATRNIITSSESQMMIRNLVTRSPKKTLFVGPGYIGAIIYGYPAVATVFANIAPWKIARILKNHYYSDILAVQRFTINPKTLKPGADEITKLSDDFIVETVEEEHFRPDLISRVVRIVGVKPDKAKSPEDEHGDDQPFESTYALMLNALNKLP